MWLRDDASKFPAVTVQKYFVERLVFTVRVRSLNYAPSPHFLQGLSLVAFAAANRALCKPHERIENKALRMSCYFYSWCCPTWLIHRSLNYYVSSSWCTIVARCDPGVEGVHLYDVRKVLEQLWTSYPEFTEQSTFAYNTSVSSFNDNQQFGRNATFVPV